jgi:hypothetical protein
MGCIESQDDLTDEEAALVEAEQKLLYQNHTPSYIDLMYRKYSNQGFINENQ